jgi:hypothetical protein
VLILVLPMHELLQFLLFSEVDLVLLESPKLSNKSLQYFWFFDFIIILR